MMLDWIWHFLWGALVVTFLGVTASVTLVTDPSLGKLEPVNFDLEIISPLFISLHVKIEQNKN